MFRCSWAMSTREAVATPERPVDVTGELPAFEDEEISPVDVRKRKRKLMLIIAAAVVVVGAGTGLTLWLTGGSTTAGLVISNEVVKVTTGTIKQTVATSGTLEPATQASLTFAVSGVVTAVDVKAGQTVTAGQVLATVGTTALQDDVDSAQAQVDSAQARLSSDKSSSAATTQIDSDEASVTSAQSSLTSAQTSLADASLTSTIAGTVASVSLAVGQQVTGSGSGSSGASPSAASSTSTTSSSDGIDIIGTDSYIVNTTVDDTEIGQITDGDQATVTPTGSTTVSYGTVASIALIGTESSDVTTFPVVIDVTGDAKGLYAGSTADVSIVVKELDNVVEVPTAAISYTTGGQATVTQVKGGRHVTTSIDVGQAASGETQITSGVKSGDQIIERVVKFTGVPGGSRSGGLLGGTGSGTTGFPTGGTGGGSFTPPSGLGG
jgi:membrane fusion protein, macrolide-specific efflux system